VRCLLVLGDESDNLISNELSDDWRSDTGAVQYCNVQYRGRERGSSARKTDRSSEAAKPLLEGDLVL
jgi:hypothetical protein